MYFGSLLPECYCQRICKHSITLYFTDVVTHFMFSFFAEMGTYRYHVVRVYTLNRAAGSRESGLIPRDTGIFRTRTPACVPLHTHMKCCNGKLLQKSTCVYAYIRICAPQNSQGNAFEGVPTVLSSPKSGLHRQLSG